ncbi:MAG TPA: hypothetical protein VIQ05_19515 [Tardiphaga sp.]
MDVDGQHRTLVTTEHSFVVATGWNRKQWLAFFIAILAFMENTTMGRGLLLWLLGVPIPVIILLWLFFGR